MLHLKATFLEKVRNWTGNIPTFDDTALRLFPDLTLRGFSAGKVSSFGLQCLSCVAQK